MKEIIKPIIKLIRRKINAGIVLLFTTIAALIIANSPFSEVYFNIFEKTYINFNFEFWNLSKPLYYWINDGLMAIFFFLIGLEVKREIIIGELSSLQKALLPAVAAFGGMLVPASVFVLFNYLNNSYINGWAIPMATDIAFALGVISLLGKKVPVELKIFLISLAVVDDIGAVVTIAIFYTQEISLSFLVIAIIMWGVLFLLNIVGVRSLWIFILIGIFGIWYPLLKSGVHATIAGIMVAFTVPMARKYDVREFYENVSEKLKIFIESKRSDNNRILSWEQYNSVDDIKNYCNKVSSPLQNLEEALHNITFYFIMPLFAFANTGIRFQDFDFKLLFSNNLPLGIFWGLVAGKVIGISLFVLIFSKLKIIKIPQGITQKHIIGAGFLAGIGFTMSIFITDLAFHSDKLIAISKVAILFASIVSGIIGFSILKSEKTINSEK